MVMIKVTGIKRRSLDSSQQEKRLKREIQSLMNKANKRLKRLEKNKLTDSPSYKALAGADGVAPRFGVRGKNQKELKQELQRINNFVNSETSTVRGLNRVFRTIADNTGIKYNKIGDLQKQANKFFEISSRVEQYLKNTRGVADRLNYKEVWNLVNEYVDTADEDLTRSDVDIQQVVQKVVELSVREKADELGMNIVNRLEKAFIQIE